MAERTVTTYNPEVLILSGLPASGKTTEALDWVKVNPDRRTRINWDDLRIEMFGKDWTFNRKQEGEMKARSFQMFHDAMRLGLSVVIDNTNLTKNAREVWKQLAEPYGVTVTEREIDTDLWECISRDTDREGRARVGRAVIERMALFTGHIDWTNRELYPCENFVICDLDGTLCDIAHRRHFVADRGKKCDKCGAPPNPITTITCMACGAGTVLPIQKDWKSFFANVSKDTLNTRVAAMLDMFGREGYHVLLVSGRPIDPCGIPTQDWLALHKIKYDHLFMRSSNDSRADTIVKKEILDLLPKSRIAYVLDDRPQVLRMWREAGLFTLAVGDGVEF
jgi:predicted kinase